MQKEVHDNLEKHPAPPNNATLEQSTSKLLPSNGKPSNSSEYAETDI